MILDTIQEPFLIRQCFSDDLDAICALQERICSGIDDPELFAPTEREENASLLIAPNTIIGVFDHDRLIAYGSLYFPFHSPKNLGWDLGLNEDEIDHCVTLDTIVVDPDYRGQHLQRTLIQKCLEYTKELLPNCQVLTTICPRNKYSLRNAQAEGFEILMHLKKYGGRDRYILGLSL